MSIVDFSQCSANSDERVSEIFASVSCDENKFSVWLGRIPALRRARSDVQKSINDSIAGHVNRVGRYSFFQKIAASGTCRCEMETCNLPCNDAVEFFRKRR